MSDNILTRTIANVTYDFAMQAYDSQDMAERMANADYEHGQSMYNPDGTIV